MPFIKIILHFRRRADATFASRFGRRLSEIAFSHDAVIFATFSRLRPCPQGLGPPAFCLYKISAYNTSLYVISLAFQVIPSFIWQVTFTAFTISRYFYSPPGAARLHYYYRYGLIYRPLRWWCAELPPTFMPKYGAWNMQHLWAILFLSESCARAILLRPLLPFSFLGLYSYAFDVGFRFRIPIYYYFILPHALFKLDSRKMISASKAFRALSGASLEAKIGIISR